MIRAWIANRWLAGAAAWGAVSAAIWVVGATLKPPELRLWLVTLAAAAWLGWEGWRAASARLAGMRLLDSIARVGARGDAAARAASELATLRAGFARAAAAASNLRVSGPDGKRRYVHRLPWYVFIGAPGSGKTTALVNSGLRFLLENAGRAPSVQGVGGTRNCDWWFTEDAVLLDTAGRYTTQGSDRKVDAASWFGFLELLKRHRPSPALNGILVTASASDLMLWSKQERTRYAHHVRMRLAELHAVLGLRVPVYVLVTKSDLIAGFVEFFGELDGAGRAQVWGTTFEHGTEPGPDEVATRYDDEHVALERMLYAEMVDRLHEERDLQRRAAIYRFPQQFHALGPLLRDFVKVVFAYRQDHQAPMLRGVYFTSGTQEGSPIDRVLGAIARSFNLGRDALTPPGGTGKSFFLSGLLREVIFPEADLAATE